MRIVTREHLEHWAERFDSKGNLPILISRLVRATTPNSTQIDFPSGSAAFVGGWDGIVSCQSDTSYVPQGISLWEFGTEGNSKGKADDDYDKRSKDPLGYQQKDATFIFVTPRFWRMKDKWIKEKKAEGIWKDVRVYDSSMLEQWIETTLAISRWFSSFSNGYPFDGIQTAEEFWEEWSLGPKGVLPPEAVTAGREFEQGQILEFLKGSPGIKGVKASTKNESIAFIIAAAKLFIDGEGERFFSKSLVIDSEANFRGIRINTTTPLNLIPRFDESQPLYSAVSRGHHVLVPLGADDSFNQEIITLPTIDRDGQINSLTKMGFNKDDAEKFSRESGRNITILKKLIGFPYSKVKWLATEDVREIIPVLLVGRWNEKSKGDIEIIEKLSGRGYQEYLVTLTKWRDVQESPLMQIGETWRLTSPLDLWTTLSSQLTVRDFEKLKDSFLTVFKDGNPILEPREGDRFSSLFNKERKYSNWLREGLAQSLILVACFGENLKISNPSNPQTWVDGIIQLLLEKANGELWISLDHELPLISEASPSSFVRAVRASLSIESPPILDMFREVDGILHSTSNHTGLLWALEGLAWLPELLRDVSEILLILSRLDPGGTLSNRPNNSLSEIFKTWHYQTLATYEERTQILEYLSSKEPTMTWALLIRMLPDHHGVAHPTHKMRWRLFDRNTHLIYTYKEIWDTHSFVVSLLIKLFDNSEVKFSQLLEKSVNFSPKDRNTVLEWAEKVLADVNQKDFQAWHGIRKILHHHRSHPDADWALPEEQLVRYEALYNKLEPADSFHKYVWLFNENWPEFPKGVVYKKSGEERSYEQQQAEIDNARLNAIQVILKDYGINKIIEISSSVKQPWALGDALAKLVINEEDILLVSKSLNNDREHLRFAFSFFSRKEITNGFEWIKSIHKSMARLSFNNMAIANLFIPLKQNKQLWEYIDGLDEAIRNEYWLYMYPLYYHISTEEKVIGLEKLIEHGRFFAAIDMVSHFADEMPTELLTLILLKAATEKASEPNRFKGFEIERIFESIDKRQNAENSVLTNLEWLYLPILSSYGSRRNPKLLHEELSKNPKFFVDVLKWIYKPKDEKILENEGQDISDDGKQNRARLAYQLLNSWKNIPGISQDYSIDEEILKKWIQEARELAKSAGRAEVADSHIGHILAQYPETTSNWPQEKIFKIIETINSEALNRNYGSALFNKRGSSTRGAFDGGDIERGHAKYFEKLSNDFKNTYPTVSQIFYRLSEGYKDQAKRMDEEAERERLEY